MALANGEENIDFTNFYRSVVQRALYWYDKSSNQIIVRITKSKGLFLINKRFQSGNDGERYGDAY